MYTIHIDGELLFSTGLLDEEHTVLEPKLSLDVNGSGSLSFVLPPGNHLYDAIRKIKSVVTVEQDGEVLFRGRVMDEERDIWNQKNVYCEGELSYLLDSQCAPYTYSGTISGLLAKLIDEHNAQMDADKLFTLGNVTAVDSSETLEVECAEYWETFREIEEKLLGAYGGYLKSRMENGVRYIDWVKQYSGENSQKIEFSVNLLDITDKIDAADVFTILIPLGASELDDDGNYTDPVNISSVNGGLKYIQDDAAVEQYGKIWRTRTWAYEEDPSKLLEKGQEYLKTGAAIQTLTLKAIDMHFTDSSIQRIGLGDLVHIKSDPHGLDLTIICAKMDIDLNNPENTDYTFGEPPRTLTENVVKDKEDLESLTGGRGGGGGRSIRQEQSDIIRWANITTDEMNARIKLNAGEINTLTGRMSQAEIDIDGVNALIQLKADVEYVDELGVRLTQAEIDIDGANANILLKADATTVDELGERVSSAEIEIDGMNSEITLKADKVYVDAEITAVKTLIADEIDAAIADIELSIGETVVVEYITVKTRATLAALALDGANVTKTTLPIVTDFTQALGEKAPTTQVTLLTVA